MNRIKLTVAGIAVAVALVNPLSTLAASNVRIVSITHPFGDNVVNLSNGVTCRNSDGGLVVGAVEEFYSGWWSYYITQNGTQHSSA